MMTIPTETATPRRKRLLKAFSEFWQVAIITGSKGAANIEKYGTAGPLSIRAKSSPKRKRGFLP